MNKPQATADMMPIRDYAATLKNRLGFPVSVQWVYKMIDQHKKKGRPLDFEYLEVGKGVWIKK